MDDQAPAEIALERLREAERHVDDGDTPAEATARHVELHKQREEYVEAVVAEAEQADAITPDASTGVIPEFEEPLGNGR